MILRIKDKYIDHYIQSPFSNRQVYLRLLDKKEYKRYADKYPFLFDKINKTKLKNATLES